MKNLMPSSHFYVQSYGLPRFGHTWGVMVNRGRNCRVYLVMRNLSWANVSERIGLGRLKKFLSMYYTTGLSSPEGSGYSGVVQGERDDVQQGSAGLQAPMVWWKFHLELKRLTTSFHSSGVVGHDITS